MKLHNILEAQRDFYSINGIIPDYAILSYVNKQELTNEAHNFTTPSSLPAEFLYHDKIFGMTILWSDKCKSGEIICLASNSCFR